MTGHILVCDDEPHITLAVMLKLSKAGFRVTTCNNGLAGWEAVQREHPDLLISDLQMPHLDGLGLVRRLREVAEFRELPVILLTAKGMELEEEQLQQELGIKQLICKPFSPRDLLKTVQSLLDTSAMVSG